MKFVARITSAIAGSSLIIAGLATPAVAVRVAHVSSDRGVAASTGAPPWRACAAIGQDPQKVIKEYVRDFGIPQNVGPVLNAGVSTLRCGTSGWGYKHIQKGKQGKWQSLANESRSQTWRDVADQGLIKTLKDPDKITWSNSRETWCLSGRINFYEGGEFVTSHFVQTILGKDTNIVSSYPAEAQCETDSHD